MEAITGSLSRELVAAGLDRCAFVKKSRHGFDVFRFTASDAPNIMHETGRLRELAARGAGGGTGKEADIDEHDTGDIPQIRRRDTSASPLT
jgi:hypothetical protein